jgi:putative transposase
MRDRRRFLYWIFEAKKRFGLCVLDYILKPSSAYPLYDSTGSGFQPRFSASNLYSIP